jgi:hypothetical protein
MAMLTKETILRATDLPTEVVDVPEWGGSVTVRSLDCAQRDEYFNAMQKRRSGEFTDMRGAQAGLLIQTVIDGEGEAMFGLEDLAGLQRTSPAAVNRIWLVALRLSGLAGDDADVEAIAGNLLNGENGGSGLS